MKKQTNDGVDAPQTTQFDGGVTPELHHKARILLSVMEAGYRPPTPLQEAVVQAIGSGESFLIEKEAADGEAAGRTLAIAVGILQRVDEAADRLQALILTPSRQSAKHMTEALQKVGARSAVRVHSCVGGALSVDDERRLLADGRVQVVVGLPGRVNVLLAREALVVDHVRALVFHRSDEAAWQTLQQQTAEILRRLPAGLQIVSDGGRRGNFCFDWIADRLPAPRRIVAKNSDGVYALGAFVEEKEEEKRDEAGAAPSTSAPQQKEDLDFSLVSNWGHYSATLLHPHMSDTTVGILMGKRYEMARPHSLQERLLQPAIDGKDVVGISPPGRGTSLAVSLLVNERVDRFVPGLQVLVLKPKPRKDVEIENYTACICELNGVEIGGCACATDDECDHPHGHQQVLVHSPTASCRTTIAERCMESDALRMVVVHRVDELLAADRPKIFAILRAKPPRVQLVITAAEMTADVLRIARDFMPPRSVNGEPSPVLLSVTKEDLQVVTYSLVGGRLKTKVHVDALRFDQIVGEANTRHVVELLRVRTEVPEPLAETPGDPQPPVSANSVEDPSDPGNQLLKPEQKASLNACLGEGHNLLLRGPPGTGKSTTAAIVVLKAVHSVAGPHAVILVPSVERTQKFKSLLDALGTKLKPSIYVCEEHPKIAADFPPPAIVIGKPRQVRELIGRGLIRPAELKVVVFAQVHKMLGAAYREDPHEVLRALPVFVQVLATSNSGDAAVVQEIDEFFNANCCVRAARMDATKAAAPVANVHFGPAFSATAHRALLDVVERLPEFRAAQPKSTGQAASGERTAKKPRKAEANAKAAKRNGPKNEKKAADRLPHRLEETDVPVDSEKPLEPSAAKSDELTSKEEKAVRKDVEAKVEREPAPEANSKIADSKKADEKPTEEKLLEKRKEKSEVETTPRTEDELQQSTSASLFSEFFELAAHSCGSPLLSQVMDRALRAGRSAFPPSPARERPRRADRSLVESLLSVPEQRGQEEWDRLHGCFADFGLKIPLVLALFQSGLSLPRPLQQRALPALLSRGNLVIEGARGAGKTTAVMIALLNQLDAENEKLQAICMTQSGKEVVRLRNQMDGLAAQMQLVVRACPDDQSAAQARALFDSKLHVLIGTGEQLHALLQRTLLISSLPSVHHFVVFELGAANTTAAFLWEIPTFHCCLRMVPVLQTVLVAERVTDEVLDLCNRLEVDFLLISTVEAKEEAGEKSRESRSGPKEDGRQTEKSDKPPDDVVLDVDSVRPELPPTAPTVEEHQPAVAIAASVPIASAASSTRGSGRSTPIFRYSFLEFNLRPELHAAVKRMGIRTTLSVQRRTIPPLLAGRNAVVRAPAGLGTLGVFLLPLLQRLEPAVGRVQAIVVCQKRSTAAEVEDALLNGYGQCLRFKTRVCLGGELVAEQLQAIAAGVHVVVGVAQRVCAIVESVQFDAQSLRFVVFDELDEQLRTGREMVHAVLRRLAADVQLVFVQREESPWVDETVRKFLADPLRVVGMDEAKAADRKKEGELKAPSNSRLPAGKEEPKEGPSKPKKKSSDESTASSTSSSSERTLVEIDSRQTTARVDTEEEDKEPEEPPEEKTIPVFSEDEEEDEKRDGESPTEAADLAHIQAPTDLLASRLAAAQLRGQLLKNRLKELRIYALEKKLGLAHGQPVDVLPPN